MKYKAKVYLTADFQFPDGEVATPCFDTTESDSRESILNFVKELHKQNIIKAYRMIYSMEEYPTNNDWYNDLEAVYLKPDCKIIELKN